MHSPVYTPSRNKYLSKYINIDKLKIKNYKYIIIVSMVYSIRKLLIYVDVHNSEYFITV